MPGRIQRRRWARQSIVECAVDLSEADPAVGARFLDSVEETLAMLASRPLMAREREFRMSSLQGIRLFPVKQFPNHLVFYRALEDGALSAPDPPATVASARGADGERRPHDTLAITATPIAAPASASFTPIATPPAAPAAPSVVSFQPSKPPPGSNPAEQRSQTRSCAVSAEAHE
jgi:hypothetical protein